MPVEYENELEYFYDPEEFHREVVYVGVNSPEPTNAQLKLSESPAYC